MVTLTSVFSEAQECQPHTHPAAGPAPMADSSAPAFPGAAYAPYNDTRHIWNPNGADTAGKQIGVPVMLLGEASEADALRRATDNAQQVMP